MGKKPLPSANKHPSRSLGPPPSPGCFPACRCLFLQEESGCGEGSPERGGQDRMGGPSPLPRWAAWGRPWLCQDGGAGPGQRVFGQVGAAGCTTGMLLGVQMWCWSPDLPAGHREAGYGISGGCTLLASLPLQSVTGASASTLMSIEGHQRLCRLWRARGGQGRCLWCHPVLFHFSPRSSLCAGHGAVVGLALLSCPRRALGLCWVLDREEMRSEWPQADAHHGCVPISACPGVCSPQPAPAAAHWGKSIPS